jgi:hypothetical protein
LSKGAKIAAFYLVIVGAIGIIWPLTGLGPRHPGFQVKSFAFKLGAYVRENVVNIFFLIGGIGLLCRKVWARKIALTILVIGTIYSANSLAWGFVGGRPSLTLHIVSVLIVGLWNGIWFFLIFRNKPKEILQENSG